MFIFFRLQLVYYLHCVYLCTRKLTSNYQKIKKNGTELFGKGPY